MAQFEHTPTPCSHWLDGKKPPISAELQQKNVTAQALHWSRTHLVQLAQEIETTKIDLSDKGEQLGITISVVTTTLNDIKLPSEGFWVDKVVMSFETLK